MKLKVKKKVLPSQLGEKKKTMRDLIGAYIFMNYLHFHVLNLNIMC